MRAPVDQRAKRWPTDLADVGSSLIEDEIFSNVNGLPLHTALSTFHPDLTEILLKRT